MGGRLCAILAGLSVGVMSLCVGGWSRGQKPPPPVPPNPQAPVLNLHSPLGMERGTALNLTLQGTNLAGPTGLWTSFPAEISIPTEDKNGQDNAKLRVRLQVPADAPVGYHALRLATGRGLSNMRLFCIDDVPQIQKLESAKDKGTPQSLPVPCTVVGHIDAERGDYYKITAQAGQRLSFEVLGRRLGSPIDPQLSLYALKTGRELAHDNDAPACQTDARLTWVFKEDGDYLIEVKDVLYRGGADYVYRLRIGDFPMAVVPLPMAAKRGSKVTLTFAGPHVEGAVPVEVTVPADPAVTTLWVAPRWRGRPGSASGAGGPSGWPVPLAVTDRDERLEEEPNNDAAKANLVPVPGGITGRLQQSADTDVYRFAAKKGQKILIEIETLELGSPTLVYFIVKNAKTNAELAKSNPAANPPLDQRIDFSAPEDSDYLIDVQHLNYVGGPSEAYHLVLTPSAPDFDLALGIDRYDVSANAPAVLIVQANRRGYTGAIDIEVEGAQGVAGRGQIKAGENSTAMVLEARSDAPLGPQALAVVGRATIDGKAVTRYADVRAAISQSLGNLPFPPRHLHRASAIAVKERAPFTLAARFEHGEGVIGVPLNLIVTAQREAGFEDAITVNPPANLPANMPPPKVAPIAKDQNEVKISLDVNPKVPLGETLMLVSAKGTHQGKEFGGAVPVRLAIVKPFDLKVEPAALELAPGTKGKLTITAQRRGGYSGPITLELRKLPANVTAGKSTVAQGQSSVEVEVSAADNAAPADVKDADVLGTAPAAANQQNNSPPLTIRVLKK